MARKSERSRRNRELENKTRQVKKTPKPDDAAPMSAEVVTPHKTLSPNKKNYRALLILFLLIIVIVIVGYKVTLRRIESARDEIRELRGQQFERDLMMISLAIDGVYIAGIQPDAATVRQEYDSSVSFDDLMRNCVFRWSALPDVQPPPPSGELDDIWRKFKAFRRKQKHIVVAYERRFELESYEGEIIVLLLSGEVKRLKKEQLAALLESQPIDTSDPPVDEILKEGTVVEDDFSGATLEPRGATVNEDEEFTPWLPSPEYQREFDRRADLKQFPAKVEGRNFRGENQYRAVFKPRVGPWNASHGANQAEHKAKNTEYIARGLEQVSFHSFIDADGVTRYQATWLPAAKTPDAVGPKNSADR